MKNKAINIVTLTCKAGFDCSTGQSIYKQVLLEHDMNRDLNCEGSLFISCIVPLDLMDFTTIMKRCLFGEIRSHHPQPSADPV